MNRKRKTEIEANEEAIKNLNKDLSKIIEEHTYQINKINNIFSLNVPKLQHKVKNLKQAVEELQMGHLAKYGSFGYKDEDGYYHCKSEICRNGEKKLYYIHKRHLDCIKDMMSEYHWWDYGFEYNMHSFLRLIAHDDADRTEWLQCYNMIVEEMDKDKEACEEQGVTIPTHIHNIAKKLSFAVATDTTEERKKMVIPLSPVTWTAADTVTRRKKNNIHK